MCVLLQEPGGVRPPRGGGLAGGTSPRGLRKQSVLGWLQAMGVQARADGAGAGGGGGLGGGGRMWRQGCEVALRTLGAARQTLGPGQRAAGTVRAGGPLGSAVFAAAACETHIVTGPSAPGTELSPRAPSQPGTTAHPLLPTLRQSALMAWLPSREPGDRPPLCSGSTCQREGLRTNSPPMVFAEHQLGPGHHPVGQTHKATQ